MVFRIYIGHRLVGSIITSRPAEAYRYAEECWPGENYRIQV